LNLKIGQFLHEFGEARPLKLQR